MVEVLALIPFVLQTLSAVDRAVCLFSRLQNAPEQIRLVRILLAQIPEDLNALMSAAGTGSPVQISTDQYDEIKDSLRNCQSFLDRYSANFTTRGTFRRVYWSTTRGMALDELRGRIERTYLFIITPLTRRLMLARINAGIIILPREQRAPAPLAPRLRLANGGADVDELVPENNIQQAQQGLPEFNTILGMNLRDILDTGAVAIDTDFRNIRGTTLFLQGNEIPPDYRTLALEELQVAARDEETTILHFRCNGGTIRIKHLVPLATRPRLSDITSLDVSFLATHTITLMCADGHHLYNIKGPRYRFIDLTMRRKFQELVRGRHLVAEFEASEVADLLGKGKPRCRAMGEPLHVWRWDRPGLGWRVPSVVTMTFLAKGQGGFDHLEWHFDDRVGEPRVVRAAGSSKRKAVEVQWAIPKEEASATRITFQNETEASRFVRLFEPPEPDGHGSGVDSNTVLSQSFLAPIKVLAPIELD